MKTFLFTVDVEEQSLTKNRLDDDVPNQLIATGMPRVLDILDKHQIKATFYYTGTIAESHPELVKMALAKGHEIGCHGYDHSPKRAFDVLTYEEQVADIKKAIQAIDSAGHRPTAFRAPAARMGKDTIKVLEKLDFATDSSISSQRFDGPLTFGSRRKLRWLFAPRGPYYPSGSDIFSRGNSNILEIPISAYISPYIGTTMRASPRAFRFVENRLAFEAKHGDRPMVFLFHPNECLDIDGNIERGRRSDSVIGHAFGDVVRQDLKLRNMGKDAVRLLDETLTRINKKGFEFMKVCDFTVKYGEKFREAKDAS